MYSNITTMAGVGAPKDNQFWKLRSKHGRDKLFASPQLMWEAACEYFEWCEKNPFKEVQYVGGGKRVQVPKMRPFTLHGLTLYLDCHTTYFNEFEGALKAKKLQSEAEGATVKWGQTDIDYSQVCTRIREVIHNQQFSGASSGFFKENIIARSLGLADKTKNEAAPTIVHNTVSLTPEEMREYDRVLEEEYVKRK